MSAEKEQHGWLNLGMLQPLDWLLLALPAALAIRYVPAWKNEAMLFISSGIAIVPLAGGWAERPSIWAHAPAMASADCSTPPSAMLRS